MLYSLSVRNLGNGEKVRDGYAQGLLKPMLDIQYLEKGRDDVSDSKALEAWRLLGELRANELNGNGVDIIISKKGEISHNFVDN